MSMPPMGRGENDRRTPPDLFSQYDRKYNFTLDAAASHENTLCDRYCTLDGSYHRDLVGRWKVADTDGLSTDWGALSAVWVNPPYGRGLLAPFIIKAHGEATENGVTVVMLLPVRTEQPWFHDIVWPDVLSRRARIDWVRGRLKFSDLGAAPFPSMVVVWNG